MWFGLICHCLRAQLSFEKVLLHVVEDKFNDYAGKLYTWNAKEHKGHLPVSTIVVNGDGKYKK